MRERLYRAKHGILMGVCKGVARRLSVSSGLVRLLTLLLFVFTGFFPVGLVYIILGLFLPVEPSRRWREY